MLASGQDAEYERAVNKALPVLFGGLLFLGSCASPPQAAGPQALATRPDATLALVDSGSARRDKRDETIFIPPPVGSLLGGGFVRVEGKNSARNSRAAVLGHISRLHNFEVTGTGQKQVLTQQNRLRSRFGELCGIVSVATGNDANEQKIADQKSKGQTKTEFTQSDVAPLANVTQTAHDTEDAASNPNDDRLRATQLRAKTLKATRR